MLLGYCSASFFSSPPCALVRWHFHAYYIKKNANTQLGSFGHSSASSTCFDQKYTHHNPFVRIWQLLVISSLVAHGFFCTGGGGEQGGSSWVRGLGFSGYACIQLSCAVVHCLRADVLVVSSSLPVSLYTTPSLLLFFPFSPVSIRLRTRN